MDGKFHSNNSVSKPIDIERSLEDSNTASSGSFNNNLQASSISLLLKASPANPETTLTESEVASVVSTPRKGSFKKHVPAKSLNDNLKEIEKKELAKELQIKKELNKKKSYIEVDPAIDITDLEGSPGKNASFFNSVWNSATNTLLTPKSGGELAEFPTAEPTNELENEDTKSITDIEQPKIISYRKRSRKISTSERSNHSDVNDSPVAASTTTPSIANLESNRSPSFNKKLYLEDLVYDTKYHYAAESRNEDYHFLFKSVIPTDRLIDDFSCALSREILLQGRIYVSESYVCFNSNILGWVTNLVLSLGEITSFEKTSTAGLFPNGIMISTDSAKHNFATFISRDSTYEFLNSIWLHYIQRNGGTGKQLPEIPTETSEKNEFDNELGEPFPDYKKGFPTKTPEMFFRNINPQQNDENAEELLDTQLFEDQVLSIDEDEVEGIGVHQLGDDQDDSEYDEDDDDDEDEDDDDPDLNGEGNLAIPSAQFETPKRKLTALHQETDYTFVPEEGKESILVKDQIIDMPLNEVREAIIGDDTAFKIKFLNAVGGSEESSIEPFKEWSETDLDNKIFVPHLARGKKQRFYQYTKALNYPVGPLSTVVYTAETIEDDDADQGFNVVVVSVTPNVPSGSAFTVQTRYLAAWAPDGRTKLRYSFWMNWTGSSWIKGIIEKSSKGGQLDAAKDLVRLLQEESSVGGIKKKKTVTGLGSPAVFQVQEKSTGRNRASSFANLDLGIVAEEIEEIENTLWDVIYHNWVFVLGVSVVLFMLFLQLKIFNELKQANKLQAEQLSLISRALSRNSVFSPVEPGHEGMKGDVEKGIWKWLKHGSDKVETSNNDVRLKQLKQQLKEVFEGLSNTEENKADIERIKRAIESFDQKNINDLYFETGRDQLRDLIRGVL